VTAESFSYVDAKRWVYVAFDAADGAGHNEHGGFPRNLVIPISMTLSALNFRRALTALAFTAITTTAHADQIVKIGFTGPLSGGLAALGVDNRDGLLMAISDLNAKGIQVGGRKIRFEAAVNDDAGDPRQGVQVAQLMADSKIDFVVGPLNSGVAIPASHVYNGAGMLMMTVASNPQVTEQGYKRVFRIGPNDIQLGTKMAIYAAKEMKLTNVAVIDDRTTYGQGLAAEFIGEANRQGIKVVTKQYTTDKATDFSAILTAIRAAKPDAIFFGGTSSQAGPLLRQMHALGVNVKLLGGDGICSSETAKLSGGTADGAVLCAQGGAMLEKAVSGSAFVAKYRSVYKRDPLMYAAAFYDAAMMLADAMQKTGSTDPGKVSDQLSKSTFKGVMGEYSFNDKRDMKSTAITVFAFKDSQPVALQSF
jgi:branched-chain amino acid transport system substrate-binding protein